jgi:manganese peroxidase
MLKGQSYPGQGPHSEGEAFSPLAGELRLKSDAAFARDLRWAFLIISSPLVHSLCSTTCQWQSYINNHDSMMRDFRAAMSKMAIIGFTRSKLTDCSEVIPEPPTLASTGKQMTTYPAGKSFKDVDNRCFLKPFPNLATDQLF